VRGPSEAPDFKQVRKYLKEISDRERLGEFIKAGWTPAELGEYARSLHLAPGRTYPTARSYEMAMIFGPERAKSRLAFFREPGFDMPPFNRPVPPSPIPLDHPDHPNHTDEMRADVRAIAQCLRNRRAVREDLPRPDADKPIPASLWKYCFGIHNSYNSLEEALQRQGLIEYATTDALTDAFNRHRVVAPLASSNATALDSATGNGESHRADDRR
jgi:hypothetical protein